MTVDQPILESPGDTSQTGSHADRLTGNATSIPSTSAGTSETREKALLAPVSSLPIPPSIDVVLPARNRAHFLPACLDSILMQTMLPKTVFVVDDGSTDHTVEVLANYVKRWPQVHIIRTGGLGVSAARNLALAKSTADLIAFIDSDDVWDPGMLAALAHRFTSEPHSRLGFVNCGLRQIDAEGTLLPFAPKVIPSKRGDIFQAILEEFYGIAPSTLMVRRDLLISVGGFDESLVQAEDRDLCLRLARVSEADYVPEVLVGLRQHGGSAYGQAMREDPEFVLFQRLQVWNRWVTEIKNLDAVVERFRAEAASTARFLIWKRRNFGLYRRLHESKFELARMLFPGRWSYLSYVLRIGRSNLVEELKAMLATRVILPNRWLLRLAQRFGRFKDRPPVPGRGQIRNRLK